MLRLYKICLPHYEAMYEHRLKFEQIGERFWDGHEVEGQADGFDSLNRVEAR